jgi:hypothetical protein
MTLRIINSIVFLGDKKLTPTTINSGDRGSGVRVCM